MNCKLNTARPGFSLIEIVVVITIIGILAALVFGGMRYVQRAKGTATENKLISLDAALESYNTSVGEYPSDLRELIEGPQKQQLAKRFGMALAKEDELKDAWGKPFNYDKLPSGTPPYELYAIAPDGKKIYSPASRG